ncbi:hypothetical protein H9P43_001496 [Blastocladiella emersonii ATCC 22665]|nr:hypothetical protein H9P43_001496 [Blastocladiella emersonii ATCC 22665]
MSAIVAASHKHPAPEGVVFTYGTAGFRMKAELLDSVIYRVGLLASLRSRYLGGKTIGVMITASHNPVQDNGVKLVDPMGEMLEQSWEAHATELANAPTHERVAELYAEIAKAHNVDVASVANVIFARDTRPSGPALVQALADGLTAAGATFVDHGLKTTPQLHYLTRCINDATYGEPTEEGYYTKISKAYKDLVAGLPALDVTVDCANGIGAPKLVDIAQHLGDSVKLTAVNGDTVNGILNYRCGADFVKVNVKRPEGFVVKPNAIHASFDGDADRIVFYYVDDKDEFHLLDGDRITALVGAFIIEQVRAAGLSLDVGVVQTAYANGNSTHYLRDSLQVPVAFTQTGVKHLHHKAEEYDIGVYFEANGHGTVIFSKKAHATIAAADASKPALRVLKSLIDVINETVGDAISDLLVVLGVLSHRGWTLANWDALYDDLPSRLVKVVVADRAAFKAINADTELAEPKHLQALISAEVAKVPRGRSFVRPSGTEDVVRVYAEAETREACDQLAYTVAGLVFDKAGAAAVNISLIFTSSFNGEATGLAVSGSTYGGYARLKTAYDRLAAGAPPSSTVMRMHLHNAIGTTLFDQFFQGQMEKTLMGMVGIELTGMATRDMFTPLDTLATNLYQGANYSLVCSDCMVPNSHPLYSVMNRVVVREFNGVRVAFLSFHTDDQCLKVTTCTVTNNGTTKEVMYFQPNRIQDTIKLARLVYRADYVITMGLGNVDSIDLDRVSADLYTGLDFVLSIDFSAPTPVPVYSAGGIPLFSAAGTGGTEVARVDLELNPGSPLRVVGSAKITTLKCASESAPTPNCTVADPVVQAAVDQALVQVNQFTTTVVGATTNLLNNTLCGTRECALGNLVADSLLWDGAARCDHMILNQGSLRTTINAGNITIGTIRTLLPFQNRLAYFKIKGRNLLDALTNGVSRTELPSGRFPQVAGMRINFHPTRKWFMIDSAGYGLRLQSVQMRDPATGTYSDIVMDKVYRMCGSDYLTSGGDGYVQFKTLATNIDSFGPQMDEVLARYLRAVGTVSPVAENRLFASESNAATLIGNCNYPPVLLTGASGTFTDYCGAGRRAYTNVTFVIQPNVTTPVRSIEVTLSGLDFTARGQDYVTLHAGPTVLSPPVTLIMNGTRVTANYTVATGLPAKPLNVFASAIVVHYESRIETAGAGLTVSYTARNTCPNGYVPVDETGCFACGTGYFKNATVAGCTACPAGSYSAFVGSPECSECAAPSYCPSAGMSDTLMCATNRGYVRKSASLCVCPDDTRETANGCILAPTSSSSTFAIVSVSVIGLVLVIGGVWYRKRVQKLRDKALGRHLQARKIKVVSKRAQLLVDATKSGFFIALDAVEIGFDWWTYLSFNEGDTFKVVYMVVAVVGTTVALISMALRALFAYRMYKISTEGIEVLQRKKAKGKRGSKLPLPTPLTAKVDPSSGGGLDKEKGGAASEMDLQATLGDDPDFVDQFRKLHLSREHLQHTQYVALPGLLKSLPVMVVELLVIGSGDSKKPALLLTGAFGVSCLSFALNLQVCGEWLTTLHEYRRQKLFIDKRLRDFGMARASRIEANNSRATMKSIRRGSGPGDGGIPALLGAPATDSVLVPAALRVGGITATAPIHGNEHHGGGEHAGIGGGTTLDRLQPVPEESRPSSGVDLLAPMGDAVSTALPVSMPASRSPSSDLLSSSINAAGGGGGVKKRTINFG